MRKKKLGCIIVCVIAVIVVSGGILGALFYNGILMFNYPSKEKYPVRGIDVSAYQGEIDWTELEKEEIQFAFIKATEGSTFVDKKFEANYENALKTNLRVGAYHFFSFESGGETQAENFCKTVRNEEEMLPPVIDIEFYGGNDKNPQDESKIRAELNKMLTILEEHYGKRPILYATKPSYDLYIAGEYEEYDIWIRDIFREPSKLKDKKDWKFWQYTNRERLKGYSGAEKYIDMNVFAGTTEEFMQYGKTK